MTNENDPVSERPPAFPAELLDRPIPRAMRAAAKHEALDRERHAQADVNLVDVLMQHRADLANLRTFVDHDWPRFSERNRQEELREAVEKLIEAVDRKLMAARG